MSVTVIGRRRSRTTTAASRPFTRSPVTSGLARRAGRLGRRRDPGHGRRRVRGRRRRRLRARSTSSSSTRTAPPRPCQDLQLARQPRVLLHARLVRFFGTSIAAIGDLDSDGVADLAVGASATTTTRARVYILFMTSSATVGGAQKISNSAGGFAAHYTLGSYDYFGISVASIDLNSDDVSEARRGGDRIPRRRRRGVRPLLVRRAAPSPSKRSRTRTAASRRTTLGRSVLPGARSRRWATSMATASPTLRWARSDATTAAPTRARSTSSSRRRAAQSATRPRSRTRGRVRVLLHARRGRLLRQLARAGRQQRRNPRARRGRELGRRR